MIRRETIDGREASVAYLTIDMQPTDPDDAELIQVFFDDGESIFLVPPPDVSDLDDEEEKAP